MLKRCSGRASVTGIFGTPNKTNLLRIHLFVLTYENIHADFSKLLIWAHLVFIQLNYIITTAEVKFHLLKKKPSDY